MNTTRLHPFAEDYLVRLEFAAQALPRQDRDELVTELRSHLVAGLAEGASDADVRNLLGDLGAPEDIVAAACAENGESSVTQAVAANHDSPGAPPGAWGAIEILAVLALTVGAFVVPVIGPIVGICLAWASVRWTRREKIVASVLTFLPLITMALGATLVMNTSSGRSSEPVPVDPLPGIVRGGTS